MENIAEKARIYAIDRHRKKNNTYGGHHYEFHLNMGSEILEEFIDLIPAEHQDNVRGGWWTHDTIEDCGETFNDVKEATNEEVAELAYACTNEKGKTRAERANAKYYRGIRNKKRAPFVKMIDRLANIKYSKQQGKKGMFQKYKSENPKFLWGLVKPEWYNIPLWIYRFSLGKEAFIMYRTATHEYSRMFIQL